MSRNNVFRILLALSALMLVLAACQAAPPANTDGGAEEPAEAPEAGQPDEIVIGVYEPMTGAMAAGGELTMQGVNLAHKQVSEVLGCPCGWYL